jgi:hypothetical protein
VVESTTGSVRRCLFILDDPLALEISVPLLELQTPPQGSSVKTLSGLSETTPVIQIKSTPSLYMQEQGFDHRVFGEMCFVSYTHDGAGRIRRARFESFVARLVGHHVALLGDVSSDGQSSKSM